MTGPVAPAVEPAPRKQTPWKRYVIGAIVLAVLAWFLARQDWAQILREVQSLNVAILLQAVPILVLNMLIRSVRWRTLLGWRTVRSWPVFSSLMIGYLANIILPVRGGDLVRVYALRQMSSIPTATILSSVVVERVLDMASLVFVFAALAFTSGLPGWMRDGALMLGLGAVAGLVVLILISLYGQHLLPKMLSPVVKRAPALGEKLVKLALEFTNGVQNFRRPVVAAGFVGATALIWLTEVMLVLIVAGAFSLPLDLRDGALLMLFSLFSSLIPAMPGQLGTFELAMVAGLDFIGHGGAKALPFAVTLHMVLLAGSCALGALCLVLSGGRLPPQEREVAS
jgi:uncharacterized protein (TIRG00374 family)